MNWLIEKKDLITNIFGFLIVLIGVIDTYVQSIAGQPINYLNLAIMIITAGVAYFTGKTTKLQ